MARSILIALLVVLAVVAPNLQPSSATSRAFEAGGGAAVANAYLQEATGAGEVRMTPAIDQQPPPPTGGGGSSQQPTECRTLLQGMAVPCMGFLVSPRVYAPPTRACCAGLNALFQYNTITCMCHAVNGDINRFLPAPLQRARMARLFPACGHNVPVDRFANTCRTIVVPPIDAPPAPVQLSPAGPDEPSQPPPPPPGMMQSAP